MTGSSEGSRPFVGSTTETIGDLPENLFREPLELLYADHFRTLVVCRLLQEAGLFTESLCLLYFATKF